MYTTGCASVAGMANTYCLSAHQNHSRTVLAPTYTLSRVGKYVLAPESASRCSLFSGL